VSEFSREWPEGDEELPYIVEQAEPDLLSLCVPCRPARIIWPGDPA
jgi:hypothetical protein